MPTLLFNVLIHKRRLETIFWKIGTELMSDYSALKPYCSKFKKLKTTYHL
ncbi:MAG: hypothetical protein US63_C0009G0022 [Candidatus Moranbacteria bacterium GW2011_GWC2_37_8]|nr:MAG: hypothetical protein US63_C0009G0022 [Candidatus Moranbacteria bacterium GW2011_GWC2_37_8]